MSRLYENMDAAFAALAKSAFRRRFVLHEKELSYLHRKGMPTLLRHAADFVAQRLAPASIANDGRQTPMGHHPVFIAQHATATCCRKCLARWHGIEKDRVLTPEEQQYIVAVIARWLLPYHRPAIIAPAEADVALLAPPPMRLPGLGKHDRPIAGA